MLKTEKINKYIFKKPGESIKKTELATSTSKIKYNLPAS